MPVIDRYIAREMRAARMPGLALAIVRDDHIAYLRGYGRADPSGRPVTAQTPFIIGSLTKSFTALAVMQLVEAGKIDLDAPVQRYLPDLALADPEAWARITVRQLLYQTSGIAYRAGLATFTCFDRDPDALERHARAAARYRLSRPAGSSFEYSNANYLLLGLLVQRVSGQSYEAYVRAHIFSPLSMRNSYVSQAEAQRHGMATGYRWWFGVPLPAHLPYNRGDLPAGYIISSAEDMAHYLLAQLNGGRLGGTAVLSPAGITLMHSPPASPLSDHGMGWIVREANGIPVIAYDGGAPHFQAEMILAPRERVGVVVLANVMSAVDSIANTEGITARRIAVGVLSLATGRALPANPGPGIGMVSLAIDGVVLALTAWQIAGLAALLKRFRRLEARGAGGLRLDWRRLPLVASPDVMKRCAAPTRSAVLNLTLHGLWPFALFTGVWAKIGLPGWGMIALYQPDLTYWLAAMAALSLLRGTVKAARLWRMFACMHKGRPGR